MPPRRDGNISTFFPANNEGKGKSEAEKPTINSPSDTPKATPPAHEAKGKGKRTNSSPPPADEKRSTKVSKPDAPKHLSSKDLPPDWLATATNTNPTTALSLTIHQGDLFDNAPANSLLVHACNTQGSWGAGIARAFRDRYPKAYTIYRDFCTKEYNPKSNPIRTGTALLIPPVDVGRREWIGCLFTSAKYGKAKAKPDAILRNTAPAMQMLLELTSRADGVTEIRMCKINSGLFGVPWEKTQEALEGIEVKDGWRANVEVWEP